MKRILLVPIIMIACIVYAICAPFSAAAEASYYLKVEGDAVSFYENTAVQAPMFTLPKTYYVKVLKMSYAPNYHLVSYNGVKGLVKVSDFSLSPEENVANPYYTATAITAHINTYLYTAPSFSSKTDLAASGLALTYLGKINGERETYDTPIWFAVLYANEVYYLHCSMTNNLSLLDSSFAPVHPNSVVQTDAPEGTSVAKKTAEQPGSDFNLVRLLLIIGMIVPLCIIFFLLFKPRRRPMPRDRRYEREDRYRDDYDDYD